MKKTEERKLEKLLFRASKKRKDPKNGKLILKLYTYLYVFIST